MKTCSKVVLATVLLLLLATAATAADYVIGEGDILEVAVWGVKDLNVSVKVRPDGKITIPGLGDVRSAGFTPRELQRTLGEKLKELVKNPIVTVTVKEITNSKVYVFGGGVRSGVYDLNRRTTLLQLLCQIGDVQSADLRGAYVQRHGKRIKEDFFSLFISGDTSGDIAMETNDAIFIPQSTEKMVYVLGAVNAPKSIAYREGLTVMEAILQAGGFTKFAKQNDTSIVRREGEKEMVIQVKAKDLVSDGDLTQNMKLQASDYVIVREGIF